MDTNSRFVESGDGGAVLLSAAVPFCTDSSSLNRLPFNLHVRGIHCQLPRMGKELTVGPRNSRTGAGLKFQHRLSQLSWRSGHVEKLERLFDQTHPV